MPSSANAQGKQLWRFFSLPKRNLRASCHVGHLFTSDIEGYSVAGIFFLYIYIMFLIYALLAHLAGPRGATGSCDVTLSSWVRNGIRTERLTNLILFCFCRISYFLLCACVVSQLFHIGVPFSPSSRCTRRRAFFLDLFLFHPTSFVRQWCLLCGR